MPNYEYEDIETGETHTRMSSYADSQKYLEENPNLKRLIGAPSIVGGVGSNLKVDGGFKEVMAKVKDTYSINNMKDY